MTSSEHNDMTGAFPVTQPSGDEVVGATQFQRPTWPDGRPLTDDEMARLNAGQPVVPPPPLVQAQPTPDEDPYAPSAGWSNPFEDFVAPSGQRCLLKKLDLPDLVKAGLLDHMDTLSPIVENDVLRNAQGKPPVDVAKALKRPDMLKKIVPILDQVLKVVVVKPELHDAPSPDEERVPGRAYVDAVSLTDKVAIFNRAAGDLDDLKSLRPEPGESA